MQRILLVACLFGLVGICLASDAALLLKGAAPYTSNDISERQIADLTTHLLNTIPIHNDADRRYFPETSLSRKSAAFFVVAESLSYSDVSSLQSPLYFKNDDDRQAIPIDLLSPDEDSVVAVTNILTGSSSGEHGVLGHSWIDRKTGVEVDAYRTYGHSLVWKVQDVIAEASNGKALTFAMSGDRTLAAALDIHHDLSLAMPEDNHEALYWSSNFESFRYLDGTPVKFGIKDVRSYAKRVLTVETASTFDLSNSANADVIFFAELAFLDILKTEIRDSVGKSQTADFVAVGISGIAALKRAYGAHSDAVKLAIELLDSQLAKTDSSLGDVFDGPVVSETVLLGTSTNIVTAHSFRARDVDDDGDDDGDETDFQYTEQDVANYQTAFWAAFLLFIAMLWASCFMLCMETGTDTLLFRGLGGKAQIQ